MAIKSNYFPTTISADFDVSVDVEIGIEEVRDWLEKASAKEIATLGLGGSHSNGLVISLKCGNDAGTVHDVYCIQNLVDTMDVTEILRRLQA